MTEPQTARGRLLAAQAALMDGITTVDQLAARLVQAGCTGQRGSPRTCPNALWYLKHLTLFEGEYIVVAANVRICRKDSGRVVTLAYTELTPLEEKFVHAFDGPDELFPELDAFGSEEDGDEEG